jgi:Rieske Fe-S protein
LAVKRLLVSKSAQVTAIAADSSCAEAASGAGLPYCLVKSVRLTFPGGGRLAVGDVELRGLDDSTAAILMRDDAGFFALSATCPHQCCTVTLCDNASCTQTQPTPNDCAPARHGPLAIGRAAFFCPCHGSQFAGDGSVLGGPAISRLPSVKVELTGDDAVVDLSELVAPGTRA